MSQAGGQWRRVADLAAFDARGLVEVEVDGTLVLLARDGGRVRAMQGLCPHQFARLADGAVKDGWLQCPHHMARFRLDDGMCGPGWVLPALRRYRVRIEDGAVLLGVPLTPVGD